MTHADDATIQQEIELSHRLNVAPKGMFRCKHCKKHRPDSMRSAVRQDACQMCKGE